MTCPLCKREDMPETCGCSKTGDTCECCGLTIIATPTLQEAPQEDSDNEE